MKRLCSGVHWAILGPAFGPGSSMIAGSICKPYIHALCMSTGKCLAPENSGARTKKPAKAGVGGTHPRSFFRKFQRDGAILLRGRKKIARNRGRKLLDKMR